MAKFNVSPPDTQDPNYLSYSRGINVPDVMSKTAGVALSGIGDVIKAGATAGDTLIKRQIDEDIYARVDPERAEYTAALRAIKETIGRSGSAVEADSDFGEDEGPEGDQMPVAGRHTQGPPLTLPGQAPFANKPYSSVPINMDVLPQGEERPLPGELERLPNTLGALRGGLDERRYSNSFYYSRLDQIASGMRNRYPGHREYIDKQIAEVTGVNPANAYITQLIGDINNSANRSRAERNREETFFNTNKEVPGLSGYRQAWQRGEAGAYDRAWEHVSNWKVGREIDAARLARNNVDKSNLEARTTSERQAFSQNIAREAAAEFNGLRMGSGEGTQQSIVERLRHFQANPGALSSPAAVETALKLKGKRDEVFASLWAKANEPVPELDGRSRASLFGLEETKKIINEGLILYDTNIKAITDKDPTLAAFATNMAVAINQQDTVDLLKNRELGPYIRMLNVFKDQGGPNAVTPLMTGLLSRTVDLPQKIREYLNSNLMRISTGANSDTGRPTTLGQVIQETRRDFAEAGITVPPRVYNEYVDWTLQITNRELSTESRIKIARAAFADTPENRRMLEHFPATQTTDAAGRRRMQSQKLTVFQRLTSQDMTAAMQELGKTDPTLWKNYDDWVRQAFAQDVFRTELADLNDVRSRSGIHVEWSNIRGVHRLNLTVEQGQATSTRIGGDPYNRSGASAATQERARRVVQNINSGLASISNLAAASNLNVEAYLIRVLRDGGVNFGGPSPITVPEHIGRALLQQGNQAREEEAKKTGRRPSTVNRDKRGVVPTITPEAPVVAPAPVERPLPPPPPPRRRIIGPGINVPEVDLN